MSKYIITICAVLLFAGCDEQMAEGPPALKYGQDECAHCGMIVSDERHAAAITTVADDGTRDYLAFDDIGDLIDYEREHPELIVHRRWVHDLKTRTWVDASTATIVHAPDLHTPMGSGLAAYANGDTATASGAGRVMDWAGAVQLRAAAAAAAATANAGAAEPGSTSEPPKPCCPGHDELAPATAARPGP